MNLMLALKIGQMVIRALIGLKEAKRDGKITKDEAADIVRNLISRAGYEDSLRVEDDTTRQA